MSEPTLSAIGDEIAVNAKQWRKPSHRTHRDPAEIAEAILFLVSDAGKLLRWNGDGGRWGYEHWKAGGVTVVVAAGGAALVRRRTRQPQHQSLCCPWLDREPALPGSRFFSLAASSPSAPTEMSPFKTSGHLTVPLEPESSSVSC